MHGIPNIDSSYLDYFSVIITTAADFNNTTACGCVPWIWRVLPDVSVHIRTICSIIKLIELTMSIAPHYIPSK